MTNSSILFTLFAFFFSLLSYRMVQVNKTKLSPPRMPIEISGQRENIWYHSEPHDQRKRVTWPKTKITALVCPWERSPVSTNDRPSFFSIISRPFPSGDKKTKYAAFCMIRLNVLQGMSVENFGQEFEHLTCLCST